MTSEAHAYPQTLGEEQSIWFKIQPFIKADDPMAVLVRLSQRYGGWRSDQLPLREALDILSESTERARRVLVDDVDNYVKYFDGLKPIFGHAMITVDGALWQKVRQPQQRYFHPDVYAEYVPYLLVSLQQEDGGVVPKLAQSGATFEMLEETWGLGRGHDLPRAFRPRGPLQSPRRLRRRQSLYGRLQPPLDPPEEGERGAHRRDGGGAARSRDRRLAHAARSP